MEHLTINTSQNVEIEHDVASIGHRMLAHLIDYAIFFGYFLIIDLIMAFSLSHETTVIVLLLIPILLYDLLFEYFYNGQNLGKRIVRIKVVKLDGTPASFGNYLIRWVFRIVDNVLVWGAVSVITLIVNGRGQRLGDIAAGTTVIRISKKVTLSQTLFATVPENYVPVYPAVKLLTEKDIEIVKDVMRFYQNNNYYTNPELADRARTALENKIKMKTRQTTGDFFRTILTDYGYYNR